MTTFKLKKHMKGRSYSKGSQITAKSPTSTFKRALIEEEIIEKQLKVN